jgi:hypothetical protein
VSDLSGLPRPALLAAVAAGCVRSDLIRGSRFVALEDADGEAERLRGDSDENATGRG